MPLHTRSPLCPYIIPLPCRRLRLLMDRSQGGAMTISSGRSQLALRRRFDFFRSASALKHGSEVLSYDALNRAANRLAHAILALRGPEPEPVALLLGQGVAAVVAILAVLKAGKFYVPLDLAFPQARLGAIVGDADAPLLLASTQTMPLAQGLAQGSRALLDVQRLDPSLDDANPSLPLGAGTLLNIMYTSGSTGQPKGVLQSHRNILHDTRATTILLGYGPHDRFSLLSPYSFGASASDIFGALLNGAALFPYDLKGQGLDPLPRWLRDEQITNYHSVPTIFRQLLALLEEEERFPAMRVIRLGGEPIHRRDVEGFQRHFADPCVLRIALATTESYVATQYVIAPDSAVDTTLMPVGYAAAGRQILILDQAERPLPPGEMGQIAVQSRFLSPGYWKQPEQTAATFLPDPSGGEARLYLTGDLGRIRPDGMLEHLGRRDAQVKINGLRVEVAEVEGALLGVPGVRAAVVEAHEVRPGEKRLVAYVILADPAPSNADLRATLAQSLPHAMIPSRFTRMERFPMLPFGKINRGALPAPDWDQPAEDVPFVAPRTPVEEKLAELWVEALGIQRVGIHHRFFEMGGNSLLATQVVTRASSHFGVPLPLTALFERPTIADLAMLVMERLADTMAHDDLARLLDEIEALEEQGGE